MQIRPMYSSVYFNIRSTLEGGLELTRVSTFFFFSKLLTGFNALTAGCYGWTGLLADLIFGWKYDCPSITVLPLSAREAIIITRQIGFVCGEYGAGFIGWIKERLREN